MNYKLEYYYNDGDMRCLMSMFLQIMDRNSEDKRIIALKDETKHSYFNICHALNERFLIQERTHYNYSNRRPELKMFAEKYTEICKLFTDYYLKDLKCYNAELNKIPRGLLCDKNRISFNITDIENINGDKKNKLGLLSCFASDIVNWFLEFGKESVFTYQGEFDYNDQYYARTAKIMEFFTEIHFYKELNWYLEAFKKN